MSSLKTVPTNATTTAATTLVVAVVVVSTRIVLQVVALRYVNNSFIIIPSEKKRAPIPLFPQWKEEETKGQGYGKPSFAVPNFLHTLRARERKKKIERKENRSMMMIRLHSIFAQPTVCTRSGLRLYETEKWRKFTRVYFFYRMGLTLFFSSWIGNTSIAFSFFLALFFAILFYTCFHEEQLS